MQRLFLGILLFSLGGLALYQDTKTFRSVNFRKKVYKTVFFLSMTSAVWSFSYAVMTLTDSTSYYYLARLLANFSIIGFIIISQKLTVSISNDYNRFQWVIFSEGVIGAILAVIASDRSNMILTTSENGVSLEYIKPAYALIFELFTAGTIVVLIAFSFLLTRKSQPGKKRAAGKALLHMDVLIIAGIVFDLILPVMGKGFNFPTSVIIQFIGLEFFYNIIYLLNKSILKPENMVRYVNDSLKTPVIIFDEEFKIRLINEKAKKEFGLSDEHAGNEYDFWNDVFKYDCKDFYAKGYMGINTEMFCPANSLYFTINLEPILDEFLDFAGSIAVMTDVTELKKNHEMLVQARYEAEQANKAKSLFLANMSHEIRTPMNAIMGFSELALNDSEEDISPHLREYFEDIHTSAQSLLSVINSILDITKIESGKMELVESDYVTEVVFSEVYSMMNVQAESKNLRFHLNVSEDFPIKLHGDYGKIREILMNLINNGIKYTASGSIVVDASIAEIREDKAITRFRISDTGVGIKEEEIGHIFEIFKRLDLEAATSTEGTGLGLSIVKGYVDLMGGEIRVESIYGEGTTFTVDIPQVIINVTPVPSENQNVKRKSTVHFKGAKFLAVDDNKLNLKVIGRILKKYGVDSELVDNGEEAIRMCAENEYYVVLMDHMMPGMDGVEAMKSIRSLNRGYEIGGNRKIIVLTANSMVGAKERMVEEGFDDFIGKPIELEAFEATLRKYVEVEEIEN